MKVEYPKGSGRVADLSDEELEYLNEFIRQAAQGLITREEATRQIGHLIDAKIEFGLELAPDGRSGPNVTGRFFGQAPTSTERESGTVVELDDAGPVKPGSPKHLLLREFGDGRRRTAYEASFRATGDFHAIRREARRLYMRGLLAKDGTLPNPAPRGRRHVDAFRITEAGLTELERLGLPVAD